ncbi:MAG: hypothetical protein J7L71_06295, partial [Spirochaetaceae bacterium]|nr:hypothetical protein [Spirochaetaceae bacterium]
LKLYQEHEVLTKKIIEVFNLISNSIESGNGEKIEIYTEIEKKYILKLENINLIIKSFEEICFISSDELNKSRAVALSSHKTIQIMDKLIRGKLNTSLSDMSAQINKFSLKPFYAHSITLNIIPQFVDLSI